ncbi:hypothetical protein FAES_3300 [Fibrella aestuarina BUZ 2]|uniref:Uncharacterized protein n=1 Tax=Fibrella aestuarina BUZ 2 TaxID=1166018 RepID=I0KB05_9BACT|nr:hypothetical protein [Fibrella aestuarina]CCH01308.1 hypothetical protein FAES_3300 [Fibrella aestuarina BUZ 2]
MEQSDSLSVHPDSLRALAMRVQQNVYGGAVTDDATIGIREIEDLLIEQYAFIRKSGDALEFRNNLAADPQRIVTRTVTLSRVDEPTMTPSQQLHRRRATIGTYANRGGTSYITGVLVGSTSFVPAGTVASLERTAKLTRRGAYVHVGPYLEIFHGPRTLAVSQVIVSGVPANPFTGGVEADINDPLRWLWPMPIGLDDRAVMVERAEIRLKGGAVATFQRKDQINNGTENALNKP